MSLLIHSLVSGLKISSTHWLGPGILGKKITMPAKKPPITPEKPRNAARKINGKRNLRIGEDKWYFEP